MIADLGRRSFVTWFGVVAAAAGALRLAGEAVAGEDQVGLAYRTGSELRTDLAHRKISARELLDAAISRVEALDPTINAVVVRDFDRARAAADNADAALARGERRPLLGLPMTVKEQFNIAGLPTTWGDPKFKDWQPEADALVVQRLKSAGAVIIGKTNVPIALADWQSYNEVYGTTNNPWNLDRSPGGSSGGSAAALAAGFVPLEFGSDIGGSLRAPAHFCGVFSHKPSLDLVPLRGSGPPQTRAIPVRGDLAVIGPMARSVADLAVELAVVAGPDELAEGVGYKLGLPPPRHDKLADFRVLVIDKHPLCPTAASIAAAINGLAERLGKSGCTILRQSTALPDLAQTSRILSRTVVGSLRRGSGTRDARTCRGRCQCLIARRSEPGSLWVARSGDEPCRVGPKKPYARRAACPLAGVVPRGGHSAVPADAERGLPARSLAAIRPEARHRWRPVPYFDQSVWAGIATLNGLPATTAPLGHSDDGLPIGVQIVGGYLEDYTTIAFAGLIEREFGGFSPPPRF